MNMLKDWDDGLTNNESSSNHQRTGFILTRFSTPREDFVQLQRWVVIWETGATYENGNRWTPPLIPLFLLPLILLHPRRSPVESPTKKDAIVGVFVTKEK
jgi:hypothetical protein